MQFRKLVALGGAAVMAGMTFAAPALAAVTNVADIGNMAGVSGTAAAFPTYIVGADAKTSDVAAAINLAAYMAGNVYTTKSVTIAGSAVPSDGVTLRTELGYTIANVKDRDAFTAPLILTPSTRSGNAASFLKEAIVTISGAEYKYYEALELTGAPLTSTTTGYSLTRGDTTTSPTYETAKKDVGMQLGTSGDIKYRLLFDTDLPYTGTNLTSKTLTFLGQTYVVTGTPTATELKLSPSGGATSIPYQQTREIAGFSVKVTMVGALSTDPVGLEVTKGGETKSVSLATGESQSVTVGGETTTVGVSRVTTGTGGGAEVTIGTAALVLRDGQEIRDTAGNIIYPNWVVRFGAVGGAYDHLNMSYTKTHSSFTGDSPAITLGKAISSPLNYFVLKNMGPEKRGYYKLTFDAIAGSDLDGVSSTMEYGIKVTARDADTGGLVKIINAGSVAVDTVAWDQTHEGWYFYNTSSQWQSYTATSNSTSITLPETTMSMVPYNTTDQAITATGYTLAPAGDIALRITEPTLTESAGASIWRLEFDTSTGKFADVGTTIGADTYSYLSYNNESVAMGATDYTNVKTRSAYVSNYGSELASAGQGQVVLNIAKTQNYWDILFGREAGTTTGGTTSSKEPVRVTADVAKLDTEIADFAAMTTDSVVVGGPAVNRAAASLLQKTYPAHGASSGITADTALVQVFQNAFGSGKVAVLIAGYEAANTDMAAAVIQAGSLTQTVPKVQISGSVSSPVITPVA